MRGIFVLSPLFNTIYICMYSKNMLNTFRSLYNCPLNTCTSQIVPRRAEAIQIQNISARTGRWAGPKHILNKIESGLSRVLVLSKLYGYVYVNCIKRKYRGIQLVYLYLNALTFRTSPSAPLHGTSRDL
jgi:hypothetical protein